METNVFVTRIFTVTTVSHVQPQEFGISLKTNAFAHHQRQFGLDHLANAPQVNTVITALHARVLDTGTQQRTNVYVEAH